MNHFQELLAVKMGFWRSWVGEIKIVEELPSLSRWRKVAGSVVHVVFTRGRLFLAIIDHCTIIFIFRHSEKIRLL